MPRKRLLFLLFYGLLGISTALLVVWGEGKLAASAPAAIAPCHRDELRSYARCLTQQGHAQLNQGNPEEALKTWERAMEAYAQLPYEEGKEGIAGSRVNQSVALQALGQYRRACEVLLPAINIATDNLICSPSTQGTQPIPAQPMSLISAVSLRTFGDVLRAMDKLENSREALLQSLTIARSLNSPADISAALLGLGNTERALYNQKQESNLFFEREDAKNAAAEALNYYREAEQEASNQSPANMTAIQAKLNRLSLLVDLLVEPERAVEIQSLIAELLENDSAIARLPLSQSAIYAKLNFARSLSRLDQIDTAIKYTTDALQQATTLQDKRAEAYALGFLGGLYEKQEDLSTAQKLTEKALALAQANQIRDIAYQWQSQLGQICEKQGKIEKAIAAYDAALQTFDLVREDLLSINPDVQFSFRQTVKPVSEHLMRLMLREPNSENLDKVLQVSQRLQLAELENFLQCSLLTRLATDKIKNPRELTLVSLDEALKKSEKPPTVIHTIVLKDGIEVIVQSPQKPLQHYSVSVSFQEVEGTAAQLRDALENTKLEDGFLPDAQKLYNWLIAPAKDILPEEGTLLFALDSLLQQIPMAVLHDGNQYLVQKYSIALTLGSRLREPKLLPPEQLRALVAGVSEKPSFSTTGTNFGELSNIVFELDELEKNNISRLQLRDREFTKERFQREVSFSDFPVIHLATHGQFSSDPDKTFILAHDVPIYIRELDSLLRSRIQGTLNPIELLVLSACETAKGDERSALGMAGVAVRAGARSTLATLWLVNDRSTADFMGFFYRELQIKGQSKAEALRHAQQALMQKYEHPHDWAPFLLLGSWL